MDLPIQHLLTTTPVLLIAGSRDTRSRPNLCAGAKRAARSAHQHGYTILVGDALGVDRLVITQADELETPIIVVGVQAHPRNLGSQGNPNGHYLHLDGLTYQERDFWMVDHCTTALYLWNGTSKGTLEGYRYAKRSGIVAYLLEFPYDYR